MGYLPPHTVSELRRLPLTLGKLAGAAAAVAGVAWMVVVGTRRPDPHFQDLASGFLCAAAGLAAFILFDAAGKRHLRRNGPQRVAAGNAAGRQSLASWLILIILAGLFLLATMVLPR